MKIFISAVSTEFKSCRDSLACSLRAAGAQEVKIQEDFRQAPGTLLEKLEAYVAECDRVIALVGKAFGAEPSMQEAPSTRPRRSYTQWEYYFAMGERLNGERVKQKDVFIYFASSSFLQKIPIRQDTESAELQKKFITEIINSGKDRLNFSSKHELCHLVLRDGFRLPQCTFKENLPYKSLGKLFKGRDGFLSNLHQRVLNRMDANSRAKRVAITQNPNHVICGLGGIGKTRLAVEYALQYADDYTALLFVLADSPGQLRRGVADLAMVLDIKEVSSTEDVEERFKAVLRWLMENPGWCLILDNVDDESAAIACEDFISKLYGGHVIITSRLRRWSMSGIEALDLDVLDRESAKEMLLERTPNRLKTPNDQQAAEELAILLDGLALGLEQAGAYIEVEECSIPEYVEWWKRGDKEITEWYNKRVMKYPKSVAMTWHATVRKIGPKAETMLRIFSCFAVAPIPVSIVSSSESNGIITRFLKGTEEYSDKLSHKHLLTKLASFSMLNKSTEGPEQYITFHRVVHDITWHRIPDPERPALVETAIKLFEAVTPYDADRFENWATWRLMLPHAEHLWKLIEPYPKHHQSYRLLHSLALYYLGQNRKSEGVVLQRQAFDLMSQQRGKSHPDTLQAKNDLALLLENDEKALALLRETLTELQKAYEADASPTTEIKMLECAYNIAVLKPHDGTNEKELLLQSCATRLAVSPEAGPDHWRTLLANRHLASCFWKSGQQKKARKLAEKTFELCQSNPKLGLHHRDTLDTLHLFAEILEDERKLEDAALLFRNELLGREKTPGLGPQHNDTLESLNGLLDILFKLDRLSEAENLCRSKTQQWREAIGADHPNAIMCAGWLVEFLAFNKKLSKAREIEVEINLAIARKNYYDLQSKSSEENRELLLAMKKVADAQKDCRKTTEAESTYLRCINGMHSLLGEYDEDLAVTLNNYGLLLRNLQRLDDSLKYYQKALEIDERLHSGNDPCNPKIPHRLNNIAMVLMMLGQHYEANTHLARAWSLKTGKHDVTSVRILWVRLALLILDHKPVQHILGQIKTALGMNESLISNSVDDFWNIESVLLYLQENIEPDQVILLTSIAEAINAGAHFHLPPQGVSCSHMPQKQTLRLYELIPWKNQRPLPFDVSF